MHNKMTLILLTNIHNRLLFRPPYNVDIDYNKHRIFNPDLVCDIHIVSPSNILSISAIRI